MRIKIVRRPELKGMLCDIKGLSFKKKLGACPIQIDTIFKPKSD